jgi:hypothetical protein
LVIPPEEPLWRLSFGASVFFTGVSGGSTAFSFGSGSPVPHPKNSTQKADAKTLDRVRFIRSTPQSQLIDHNQYAKAYL